MKILFLIIKNTQISKMNVLIYHNIFMINIVQEVLLEVSMDKLDINISLIIWFYLMKLNYQMNKKN